MKNFILLLFLISSSVQLFSQKFTVVPQGIRSQEDTAKNFIVLEFKNKTPNQLYNSVKKYIAKTSVHQPRVYLADITDSFLRTKSYTDNIANYKGGLLGNVTITEGEFITTFEFKDNKIKISISNVFLPNNGATPILFKSYVTHPRIFNLDGTEAKSYLGVRSSLENFLNSKLTLLIEYINEKDVNW
ncbi:MAG: hypothetical protein ACEQSF_03500 [Solirubrobacteraceae bacterium]